MPCDEHYRQGPASPSRGHRSGNPAAVGAAQSALASSHTLTNPSNPHGWPSGWQYHCPHFTDEETKAEKGTNLPSRPQNQNFGRDHHGLSGSRRCHGWKTAGGPILRGGSTPRSPPHLKHHLRSGVPSELLPTVTISPERKAFLRNTGKERSMSRMVVAHCREGGAGRPG